MKLAASNIAWAAEEDEPAAEILVAAGFQGIEVAPPRVWRQPDSVPKADVDAFRRRWQDRGLRIVALQALLFGRSDLVLFDSAERRQALTDYLLRIIELAAGLGAHALVFGSPRNRLRTTMDAARAREIAVPFFRRLGEAAEAHGVCFCIEANPSEYGCDFIITTGEAADLVAAVASPGFRLHLDAGGMTLRGEAAAVIAAFGASAVHYHVSEPNLAEVGSAGTDHHAYARALAASGYRGWASIEMRAAPSAPLDSLRRAVAATTEAYAPAQE